MENDKWKMIRSLPLAVLKRVVLLGALPLFLVAIQGQPTSQDHPGDPDARVIEGVSNTTVFGLGQSIKITGTVKEGAIAFGGEVIGAGSANGDAQSLGGSGIQRA